MSAKINMSTTNIRNLMLSRINYNINDPQKKRIAAIVNFVNQEVKKYKAAIKILKKNNFLDKISQQLEEKPLLIEQIKYMYAVSSYIMLVSLQQAQKKNKLTKEQCDNVTSDINYLIKKYNIDLKKDKMGYNKDSCTKKYKTKKNCTKKICGG